MELERHQILAGIFEIAEAGETAYFFKLTAPDGTVVAVSPLFNTIKAAAAGITAVRENAATGLVVDRSGPKKNPPEGREATRPGTPPKRPRRAPR
jgi:uncharacterized protein YegP (UPF0339 family)